MTTNQLPNHAQTTHDAVVKLGWRRKLFLVGAPLALAFAALAPAALDSPEGSSQAAAKRQEVVAEVSHQTATVPPALSALLDGPAFSEAIAQALALHRSALVGLNNGNAFSQAVLLAIESTSA